MGIDELLRPLRAERRRLEAQMVRVFNLELSRSLDWFSVLEMDLEEFFE